MNVVRQNTDYAFRIVLNLARLWPQGKASARTLADQEDIAYQFTCKILQILREAGLVASRMGPKGGYQLGRPPQDVSMADVVNAVQGPISVNACILNLDHCPRQPHCPVSAKLAQLQNNLDLFLTDVTLAQLLETRFSQPSPNPDQHHNSTGHQTPQPTPQRSPQP